MRGMRHGKDERLLLDGGGKSERGMAALHVPQVPVSIARRAEIISDNFAE